MMAYLIQQEELMEATGYSTPGHLRRFLQDRGIWFEQGRNGRIFTTPAAFESLAKGAPPIETLFDNAA